MPWRLKAHGSGTQTGIPRLYTMSHFALNVTVLAFLPKVSEYCAASHYN